ncbi:MAG: hypothetical protein ACHQFW_12070, partial [Chitinophagales bacterium]
NLLKMQKNLIGNTTAFENDSKYIGKLRFDYLYYNFYIASIMIIPVFISFNYFNIGESTLAKPVLFEFIKISPLLIITAVLFVVHVVEMCIYFFKGENKKIFIEELAFFDHVRISIFFVLMILSGPIIYSVKNLPVEYMYVAIAFVTLGDIALKLWFNQDKETVIF